MTVDPIPPLKASLADELVRLLRMRDTLDVALADTHGSELSRIRNGHLERFSLERLIRMLARVRRRVEMRIVVEPPGRALAPARPGAVDKAGAETVRGATRRCGNPASGVSCPDCAHPVE
jgi:hypothetical protein